MTFKEAVQKMLEGMVLQNKWYPTTYYWFDREKGVFRMKNDSDFMSFSRAECKFDKCEMFTESWKVVSFVSTYLSGHDFIIRNFDVISDNDKQELFRILKKYKDTTTDGR